MPIISLAIETSCRAGQVAIGRDETLLATAPLGATGRHAADLLGALDALLGEHQLGPGDIDELYISAGPGSYTGLRVGVTVARIMAQLIERLRLVAVPTAHAIAQRLAAETWDHLAVLLAAKLGEAHITRFDRDESGQPRPAGQPLVARPEAVLADWPRPITLCGEGLAYIDLPDEPELTSLSDIYPDARSVWQVGRSMARHKAFTEPAKLVPHYARRPEAVRLWEQREAGAS
jgi:tRNA threonylcarbamoyladenosine biosynthesis protein TsaB